VEKEKTEFIESQMAERRSEIETLKQRHRSCLIFLFAFDIFVHLSHMWHYYAAILKVYGH